MLGQTKDKTWTNTLRDIDRCYTRTLLEMEIEHSTSVYAYEEYKWAHNTYFFRRFHGFVAIRENRVGGTIPKVVQEVRRYSQ